MFTLHPTLVNDTIELCDLNLSKLLIIDNSLFPWFVLVPKVLNAKEIIDLSLTNRTLLYKEIEQISFLLKQLYNPDKINIAALGNVVSQLHVHVIARFQTDIMWPKPVFNCTEEKKYTLDEINEIKKKIKFNLLNCS